MNQNRPDMPGKEEERIRSALRSLEHSDADPGFQERLRADFVSGRIQEAASGRARQAKIVGLPSRWRWAAAAVLVVGVFAAIFGLSRRTSWEIMDVRGTGEVVAQGSPIPASDTARLGARLGAGGRLETRGDAELNLVGGDAVALGVAPGTDVQIQRPPARWLGRSTRLRLFAGELRIVTGPDFPGATLVVHTPEGMVRLTGTAVAVYRDPTLTCICVLEGTAAIGVDAEHLEDVPPGKRKVMFADEREPVVLDIEPQHKTDLQEFIDRARPQLDASAP